MTQNSTQAGRIVIRYRGQGGALVTVTDMRPEGDSENYRFTTQCTGCWETMPGRTGDLGQTRTWANKHAAACRALPQDDLSARLQSAATPLAEAYEQIRAVLDTGTEGGYQDALEMAESALRLMFPAAATAD